MEMHWSFSGFFVCLFNFFSNLDPFIVLCSLNLKNPFLKSFQSLYICRLSGSCACGVVNHKLKI